MRTLLLLLSILLSTASMVACGGDDRPPGSDGGRVDASGIDGSRPGDGGRTDAPAADAAGTDAPAADAPTADAPASSAMLGISLQTDGGFAGRGTDDYTLVDGVLTVHQPFVMTDCVATLTPAQYGRLVTAARAVDWPAVMAAYINPSNPTCCCDQFTYMLDVDLEDPPASPTGGSTRWCDETTGDLPADLAAFLSELDAVGAEVVAGC
jgi:hypothetical protein